MALHETLVEKANLTTLADPNRGRFVIIGLSKERNWQIYTGMGGRSPGSKNRYYQELEDLNGYGNYIRTAVHDLNLQQGDPSATLYIAQRDRKGWHVASNGEQTEGISIAIASGNNRSRWDEEKDRFERGQRLYKNEGKKNAYTSRISAAVSYNENYAFMGEIVREQVDHENSQYRFYYLGAGAGTGLNPRQAFIIYTYDGKGGTDPDYEGPRRITLSGTLEENMDLIWNTWDSKTKAGLVGKEIERGSGRFTYSFRSIHEGRPGYTA